MKKILLERFFQTKVANIFLTMIKVKFNISKYLLIYFNILKNYNNYNWNSGDCLNVKNESPKLFL